jgi:alpha-methylacyl-CoA racemase
MASAALPLDGLKVLDFSTLLPGPLASLILAEAGAQVIKVERPGSGDEMRSYCPSFAGASGNFVLLNRGKRSLMADLKNDGDRDHVRSLALSADVLIEQFRPGVMKRLGLGFEDLVEANPQLIYCSITGYGQSGARAAKAGHDLNYLAETGLLGLTRGADGAPVLPQLLAADIGGGAYPAVINILLALQRRTASGQGCQLDVAMADNLFTFAYWGLAAGHADKWPRPGAELVTGGSPRYQIYPTADGEYLAAAPIEERFWQTFCNRIGLELGERDDRPDPQATKQKVAALIAKRCAADWRATFADADVCVSIVASLEEAATDPVFVERGLFDRDIVGPRGRMPALPVPVDRALRAAEITRAFPAYNDKARRIGWVSH